MSKFPDMLQHLGGVPVGNENLFLAGGKWYFCDPTNGLSTHDGTTPERACSSLETLYGKLRDGKNDGILFIGGSTAYNPAASIAWDKNYAHLIGISSPVPGEGSRCRIEGTAALDLVTVMTVGGSGCVFKNIKISNIGDANTAVGCVIVTGGRNSFINCMIAGMGHATPAAVATGYSLKLNGAEECLFYRCTIGRDTIIRAAANTELWLTGGAVRNKFIQCEFVSQSATSGKFLVLIDNIDRYVQFEDCLFYNFSTNWGTQITDAFSVTASATHYIIFRGNNQIVGPTGWADTTTRIYTAAPVPATGAGVSVNPAA